MKPQFLLPILPSLDLPLCTVQWMNIYCIYTSTVIVGKSYGTLFYKYSVITNMIDDDLLKDLQ